MHELSVCQALIEQVESLATQNEAERALSIELRIGPLSGVEPELLRQAYPPAAAGTLADGAELIIREQPVRVRCNDCGAETDATPNRLLCGSCGGWRTQLLQGDELLLAKIEFSTKG